MKRRDLLKLGAASSAGLLLPLGHHAWGAQSTRRGPRLVVLFLRGAVDGLNVVAPYAEAAYYDYRPSIAVNQPGEVDGLIDLDGHFGLRHYRVIWDDYSVLMPLDFNFKLSELS